MTKQVFRRSEAIEILNELQDDADYMEEEDKVDYTTFSNEKLEAELCLCGYIHDEYMGGVID